MIEGDEYDTAFFDKGPKFMHYRPDTALIGTVEFDHADIYRDVGEVERVFRWLTNIVPRRGLIVRHEDCEVTRAVTAKALSRVTGYGLALRGMACRRTCRTAPQGIAFRILARGHALGRHRPARFRRVQRQERAGGGGGRRRAGLDGARDRPRAWPPSRG